MDATRLLVYVLIMLFIWRILIPYTFKNIKSYNLSSAMFAVECGVFIVLLVAIFKIILGIFAHGT